MIRFTTRTELTAGCLSTSALTGDDPPAGKPPEQQSPSREAPMKLSQVRGTVQGIRRVKLRGSDDHAILVLLRTADGRRAVADLGTGHPGIPLSEGDDLAVRGRPVRIGERKVILRAIAFRHQGRIHAVERPSRPPDSAQPAATDGQRKM